MQEPVSNPTPPRRPQSAAARRERRASPRVRVGYLRCRLPGPAVILDASQQGLRIESFRPYRCGLRVLLRGDSAGRPQPIAGEVKWCRRIATAGQDRSPVYHVGIALDDSLEGRWMAALLEPESAPTPGRIATRRR